MCFSQSNEIFLHENDEDIVDENTNPVTVRGALVSLLYLRHLRIRELKVKTKLMTCSRLA